MKGLPICKSILWFLKKGFSALAVKVTEHRAMNPDGLFARGKTISIGILGEQLRSLSSKSRDLRFRVPGVSLLKGSVTADLAEDSCDAVLWLPARDAVVREQVSEKVAGIQRSHGRCGQPQPRFYKRCSLHDTLGHTRSTVSRRLTPRMTYEPTTSKSRHRAT